MKSTVVLCLLVVLCTVNATVLNSLLIKVKSAKLLVKKSQDQVNKIRNDAVQEIDYTIMKKWLSEIENLKKYIERTLKAMNKELDKVKGKENAQVCYNAALNFTRHAEYALYTQALLCHECAKISINSSLDFIDDLVSTGDKLWLDLDNIFLYCYCDSASGISDILKLRECINDQLKKCNDGRKVLERYIKEAKFTAKTASGNVIKESNKCLNDAYSDAQSHIMEAEEIFNRCLKTL